MTLKIGDLAAAIHVTTPVDRDVLRNQVRGLRDRGLLKALAAPGGVDRFAPTEVYVARLLIAAIDGGVSGDSLHRLESEIRRGRTAVFPDTGNFEINLDANLKRIADGENWIIECARSRDPEAGSPRFSALWVRIQEDSRRNRFGPHHHDPHNPTAVTVDGSRIESVLTINASALLRPLIKAAT